MNIKIITDPVTKKQFSRDLDVAGSTFEPYAPAASQPASSPNSNSYIIQKNDTLSGIAASKGTTVADIMKANPTITNANLIYPGKTLNLPGGVVPSGSGSNVPDYSQVSNVQDANKAINAGQEQDVAKATISEEPPTRKTTEDVMKEITAAVTPKEEKPAPNFEQSYLSYRTQYGVDELETQLNQLRSQEQDIITQKEARVTAERGKPVAMNVIEGRVSEAERQENERLTIVQRSITNLTNQLKTKYDVVNTLMKTKEMDYNSASADYDKQMANNISMFNAARNISEDAKTEIEKEQDNARSNAQIVINSMAARGLIYNDLSPSEQTNLTKIGVQSGLGADFFSNVLKVSTGKEILTTIIGADQTTASVIYKDGTTKTISTGLPAKAVSGDKPTESENKVFYKQSMEAELKKVVGTDGFVSPKDWAKARKNWTSNTAYLASDFDDAFRGYINPSHPADYAGFENYKPGFIKMSADELKVVGTE